MSKQSSRSPKSKRIYTGASDLFAPPNLKKSAMKNAARIAQIRGDTARKEAALKPLTISPKSFMNLSVPELNKAITVSMGHAISASNVAKSLAKHRKDREATRRYDQLGEQLRNAYENLRIELSLKFRAKSVRKPKKSVRKPKKSVRKSRSRK